MKKNTNLFYEFNECFWNRQQKKILKNYLISSQFTPLIKDMQKNM